MSKVKTADKKPAQAPASGSTTFKLLGREFRLTREDKISYALLLLLLFVVYSIRSNFSLIPFERDEGIYSYFGKLVLEGKRPYVDFAEVKFPGLFYFYAFMVSVFGETVKGMHTGFAFLNLANIVILFFAARRLWSPIAGLVAATTFAFVSLTPNLSGFTVQSEHGVAFFVSLGFLFYALSRKSGKWYFFFLMGLSMGMALLIKTNAIFLCFWGALIILIDFAFSKPRQFKTFLIQALSYAAGGIAIIGFFFMLIYLKGTFEEMIYSTIEAPRKYINNMPMEEGMKYFKYTRDAIVQNHKFFWMQAVLALLALFVKEIDFKTKLLGITVFACSFLTIVPGYFFYGHYWIQAIPGLALVAGLACHAVTLLLLKIKLKLSLRYAYLIVFGLLTVSHVSGLKSYYFHPNYELIMRQVYGNNPFPEAMELGNFINSNSKPEDNIVLIGSEPQIYFYTKKKCPSRFAYFTALVNKSDSTSRWQREFTADTEKAKPRYVIFFNHQLSLLVQPGADQYVFEWANKFITDNYNLIGVVEMRDGYASSYIWREQLATFKPQSQSMIYVYERKS